MKISHNEILLHIHLTTVTTLREVPETAGGDRSVFQDYMLALC